MSSLAWLLFRGQVGNHRFYLFAFLFFFFFFFFLTCHILYYVFLIVIPWICHCRLQTYEVEHWPHRSSGFKQDPPFWGVPHISFLGAPPPTPSFNIWEMHSQRSIPYCLTKTSGWKGSYRTFQRTKLGKEVPVEAGQNPQSHLMIVWEI